MKFTLKAVAAAVMLAMPGVSQAQIDNSVSLKVLSHPYITAGTNYSGNGRAGGFLADFAIDFPQPDGTVNFSKFLVWCIDANRTISVPGGPYNYQAFTALDFAANTSFGSPKPYNVTVSDMGKIVTLVDDLRTNWSSYNVTQRADRQGSIWALFRGEATVASLGTIAEGDLDRWVVLYNGQNQTFLTNVAEPSQLALLMSIAGGFAFLMIARRRRS
jgi:hypothetical protein